MGNPAHRLVDRVWLSSTRGQVAALIEVCDHDLGDCVMKKLAIATAAVLALLSVAGCADVGKGKAPPPVVTKG
jgi:hypothetical protein